MKYLQKIGFTMPKASILVAVSLLIAGVGFSAQAHHSVSSQFDFDWPFNFDNAVLKSARFVNPHAYLYFEVENEDGEVVEWAIETQGIQGLRRAGLGKDVMVPGEVYKIRGVRAHNGKPNGFLGEVVMPDGTSHQVWAGDPSGR